MIESGLSAATIHSLVQKLKQGKEAPIATAKASQFHNAEQQNPLLTSHLVGHVPHSEALSLKPSKNITRRLITAHMRVKMGPLDLAALTQGLYKITSL